MTRLAIRDYSEKDKQEIVMLLQRGLTEQFSVERWNWLHHNDVTYGSHIVVALYENEIVGTVGAIKKKFVYNNEAYVGGRHIDPVVDNKMRGKGVFTKMLNALNEMCVDVDFSYTFPNGASFPGFAKTGYTSVGPILMPYCQLGFWGKSAKEKIRFFTTGAKTVLGKKYNIVKTSIDDLKNLKPVVPQNRYLVQRDYHYLKWRYSDSPVKEYQLLACRHDNAVQNACVVTVSNGNVFMVDLMEYESRINISDYLKAIREMYGNVSVGIWNSSLLGVNKYFSGKSKQNFLVREGRLSMPDEFFRLTSWFISKGEVESN